MKGMEYGYLDMQIIYKNISAEKQFSTKYKKKWRYPEQVKRKLEAAENYINSAPSLMDVASYNPFHFERLKLQALGSQLQMYIPFQFLLSSSSHKRDLCKED